MSEDNPAQKRIRQALNGELNSEDLTPEEAENWWEQFEDAMRRPGPDEAVFFKAMRARHQAAGVNIAELGDTPEDGPAS